MLTKHMTVTATAVNFLRENSSGWRLPSSCRTQQTMGREWKSTARMNWKIGGKIGVRRANALGADVMERSRVVVQLPTTYKGHAGIQSGPDFTLEFLRVGERGVACNASGLQFREAMEA